MRVAMRVAEGPDSRRLYISAGLALSTLPEGSPSMVACNAWESDTGREVLIHLEAEQYRMLPLVELELREVSPP